MHAPTPLKPLKSLRMPLNLPMLSAFVPAAIPPKQHDGERAIRTEGKCANKWDMRERSHDSKQDLYNNRGNWRKLRGS